jgi:hypothetical protein
MLVSVKIEKISNTFSVYWPLFLHSSEQKETNVQDVMQMQVFDSHKQFEQCGKCLASKSLPDVDSKGRK